ncbi:hypoxanthine phosphoribosyltransferase [candidate division GN15 bacterium]|nr:hypoxanthine phosphoribosyltransferase [candidate division GN15 bacterium]
MYQPFEVMLAQDRIARRTAELGRRITEDYQGKKIVLLGILKGCIVFLADLMREIQLPMEIEFLSAASYRKGIQREDDIVIGGGVEMPLKGKHILVVDGIVDSARTISTILERLRKEEPASLEIVTLLDKPASHRSEINIRYKGFSIGNEFVIGYGLDNTQLYRNLPFVGRLLDE